MVLIFQLFIHSTAQQIIIIEKDCIQLLCKDLWTFVVFLWMCILDGQCDSHVMHTLLMLYIS